MARPSNAELSARKLAQENGEEEKPKSTSTSMLSDEQRSDVFKKLEDLGFKSSADLDDMALINKLSEIAANAQARAVELETISKTDGLAGRLNSYVNGTMIDDLEFAERLLTMNVHKRYLRLFRNADRELDNKKIWERIRRSGINPMKKRQIFETRHEEEDLGTTDKEFKFAEN